MPTQIRNCTPHAIVLVSEGGHGLEAVLQPHFPKGQEPRVETLSGQRQPSHPLTEVVNVHRPDLKGSVTNLPDPEEGVYLVVSAMVGNALWEEGRTRYDVLVPGTGPHDGAIREPDTLPGGEKNPRAGQVKAVTRLKRVF